MKKIRKIDFQKTKDFYYKDAVRVDGILYKASVYNENTKEK